MTERAAFARLKSRGFFRQRKAKPFVREENGDPFHSMFLKGENVEKPVLGGKNGRKNEKADPVQEKAHLRYRLPASDPSRAVSSCIKCNGF